MYSNTLSSSQLSLAHVSRHKKITKKTKNKRTDEHKKSGERSDKSVKGSLAQLSTVRRIYEKDRFWVCNEKGMMDDDRDENHDRSNDFYKRDMMGLA